MKSVKITHAYGILSAIFIILTLLLLATRGQHFSSLHNLPSASIAVFFLAGMYLRSIKAFWFYYLLTVAIDLGASYMRGQFGDCITTSYPALVLSYGVMFSIGRYVKPMWYETSHLKNFAKVALGLFVASSIAFFISNGSYYVFSGNFSNLSWAEYTSRVDKYYLRSISNPIFYVFVAFVLDFTMNHFFTNKLIAKLRNGKV
ncbi:hypothetical protein [Thalassotalea sediminis]|uniref:hypothetical protein n=1 Tax=Thalassotalea sediminis TaxID=1759089 RepID=UPI0025743FE7|nr:hypothetical protein [Thalassotalea sediminis]